MRVFIVYPKNERFQLYSARCLYTATNAGAALILLSAVVLGSTLPALPVQLLWVNMTTAILLGLTLVFEPKEPGLMQRPPRDLRKPLLTFALAMRTGLVSMVMLAGAYWLFFWEMQVADETIAQARTSVINVIVLVETAYLFNCRSLNHSVFSVGFFPTLGWLSVRSPCLRCNYSLLIRR